MYRQTEGFNGMNDDTILWRYQDIPRYIDLLLKRQLFFSRADRFEDPFEGAFVNPHKESLSKEFVTINSWHVNTTENYAMWKIYATGEYGLAIQTTFGKLKEAFNASEKDILISRVQYCEDQDDFDDHTNTLVPYIRKRKIYEYENEVRCLYVVDEHTANFQWQEQDKYDGIFIDVELETLIEKVYISPYSPKWIREIIDGINSKFSIDKQILHSAVFESENF